MNIKNLFKQITLLCISFYYVQLDSTVKVFVNDSSKNFIVQVYDHGNNIVTIHLKPGSIKELFIEGKIIDKIVIQDESYAKKSFGSMSRQILRKETAKINENMIFIIHQNALVKMYKGTTSKDQILQEVDNLYAEKGILPTIDITIKTKKADKLSTEQEVVYSTNYKKDSLH